jgi:hypothetical protein
LHIVNLIFNYIKIKNTLNKKKITKTFIVYLSPIVLYIKLTKKNLRIKLTK